MPKNITKNEISDLFMINKIDEIKSNDYTISVLDIDKNDIAKIFKLITNDKQYFFIMSQNKINAQSKNCAYEGYSININTDEIDDIVIKITDNKPFEIHCLQKVNLYLAHTNKYLLMTKAKGYSYEYILNKKIYDTKTLIDIHMSILDKFAELNNTLEIMHNDAIPGHCFITMDKLKINVEIIDYDIASSMSIIQYHDALTLTRESLNYYVDKYFNFFLEKMKDLLLKQQLEIRFRKGKDFNNKLISQKNERVKICDSAKIKIDNLFFDRKKKI